MYFYKYTSDVYQKNTNKFFPFVKFLFTYKDRNFINFNYLTYTKMQMGNLSFDPDIFVKIIDIKIDFDEDQ